MPEAPTAIDWQLPRRRPARSEAKLAASDSDVIPDRRARRCDIAQEYECKIVTRRASLYRPETLFGAKCSLPRRSYVPSAKGRRRFLLVSRASSLRCVCVSSRWCHYSPRRQVTFPSFFPPPAIFREQGRRGRDERRRGRRCASA